MYNAENYIQQTLRSVLDQTHRELEIIVVNDGSKDNSEAKVKEMQVADNRIKLVSKKNTGVCDSRNIAIEMATGDYFALLDADDIWEKTNVEDKLAAMKTANRQWAYSNLSFIDGNSVPIEKEQRIISTDTYKDLLKWEEVVPGPCSNIIISRELMGDDIRFDLAIPCPADRDICIQLARKAEPVFIDKKLWQYRIHNASMTASNKNVGNEMAIMYEKYKIEGYFPDNKTRRIALSTVYLIIAGICFRFTKERSKAFSFLFKSFAAHPFLFFKNMLRKMGKSIGIKQP